MLIFRNVQTRVGPLRSHRHAIVTLEAIIWLPVLAILLAAVIEMGLIMTGSMHVAAASRLGAKLAAENASLSMPGNAAAVANSIRTDIDNYFQNAGYGMNASSGVRVQTTLNGGESEEDGTCPEQNTPALPMAPPNSVRVVVCIDVTTVAPNLLNTFGFDTSSLTLELATTFPYEVP